ncbi:DUF1801 domain-containing protein [Candidatus Woesebacteria bacterium]|nr:DUF1801 domain-containing protein [Candidatus Woesebacteria bacterium]MCD8507434.1 DUF1801 domain-containing protein [Candidatus Woesebacteria bacterium]MCD8526875.1 DUF1801 domain-containing protein [Candidatus Woesebacteria bacterium]MCD8545787.1 DUF1801 domain-containing protein [Candidatus Woesebacteria bacterium]
MPKQDVSAFFADIPEPRKSHFEKLHAFIRKQAPKLEPYIEGKFLGYGKYHYRYASGREGDWFTVGLGNNKNSLAVYVVCTEDGKYITEKYQDRLKADIGKSCIRFKKFEDIDWKVLGELLTEAQKLYQPVVTSE